MQIIVKNKSKKKALYAYLNDLCIKYKNLKNVANFHIRQHLTGLKPGVSVNQLQAESIQLFEEYVPKLNANSATFYQKRKENILNKSELTESEKEQQVSKLKAKEYKVLTADKWFPGYELLEGVLRLSENSDYQALPGGVNQQAIKDVIDEWKAYFKLNKLYNQDAKVLTGRPRIPKYIRGQKTTATLNNVVCKLKKEGRTRCSLRFPKTTEKLALGNYFQGDEKLIEVQIKPVSDYFVVYITTDDLTQAEEERDPQAQRAIAIDVGMKNIITITNNVGEKPILIKGNIINAKNTYYLSKISEEQTKLSKHKRYTSKKVQAIYAKRERVLSDYFHKVCKYVLRYCKTNKIDTIIIGRNKELKQNLNIGTNNQTFAYLPFGKLYQNLAYLCQRADISYLEIDEAYTSKASFFDNDTLSDYEEAKVNKPCFSGKRLTRDIYQTKQGYRLNADVNGSLNIMRKHDKELTKDIKLTDVNRCLILGYYSFYQRKTTIN